MSLPLAQVFLHSLLVILLAQSVQSPSQDAAPVPNIPRIHLKENGVICSTFFAVKPIYPKEARLANIQGVAKLVLVIAKDGSVANVQSGSGDPLLLDSAMKAVRQWRFAPTLANGNPAEAEVPLAFTFRIEDPPKPAYLHLANGEVIRAEEVREFTNGIEYTINRRTHRISSDLVTDILACARVSINP